MKFQDSVRISALFASTVFSLTAFATPKTQQVKVPTPPAAPAVAQWIGIKPPQKLKMEQRTNTSRLLGPNAGKAIWAVAYTLPRKSQASPPRSYEIALFPAGKFLGPKRKEAEREVQTLLGMAPKIKNANHSRLLRQYFALNTRPNGRRVYAKLFPGKNEATAIAFSTIGAYDVVLINNDISPAAPQNKAVAPKPLQIFQRLENYIILASRR